MDPVTLIEIDAWLATTDTPAADIASRVYLTAKGAHTEGQRPGYLTAQWHNMPMAYRAFLVSLVQAGIDNAKFGIEAVASTDQPDA